jgi:hypothetical protein
METEKAIAGDWPKEESQRCVPALLGFFAPLRMMEAHYL